MWKVWIGDFGYVLTDEQYRRVHSECSWNRWDNKFVDNEWIGNPLSIDEIEDDEEEEDEESDPGITLNTWHD